MPSTSDLLGRPLRNLRISVTDRCNLRCAYCMPEQNYVWLPRADTLRFEELAVLVDAFALAGADRVRITGGEPLLRHDLARFVRMVADKPAIRDLALTTNGLLLAEHARELAAAGLHRLTVSLDTLRPETFRALAQRDELTSVLRGVERAVEAGFRPIKIDTVVMARVNDGELVDLVEYARGLGAEVRFIEYMDVGGATRWSMEQVVSRAQMLDRLASHYGPLEPIVEDSSAPAERFRLPDGLAFGIISSTTAPFCRSCDRSRLTADGMWLTCLYARAGLDLRARVRAGASVTELAATISRGWALRSDRGAEARLGLAAREPLVPRPELRVNPHLEMHTRGG
ncbi:MAG: GTP 3',8-cyclase MoaA [Deltaproteobacteria bacterium]|nr:GTP 3',8-cyclase MoaA [Deltaproteobacteria bacterium]